MHEEGVSLHAVNEVSTRRLAYREEAESIYSDNRREGEDVLFRGEIKLYRESTGAKEEANEFKACTQRL